MLRLRFSTFDNRNGGDVTADAFTLYRGNLEAWPEGRLIARHVDNEWEIDGRRFVRFECSSSVSCLFETADRIAERYGPFDGLSCVDGVLWAGSDAIAALKKGEWASMGTKRAWPKLRLASEIKNPAAAGSGAGRA